MNDTQQKIELVCDSIKALLLDKNKKYGDSAISPIRVFSKASATEQIFVRIDDKLSRISRGVGLLSSDEDVINDLIGYLILLKVALTKDNQWEGEDVEPVPMKPWSDFWKTSKANDLQSDEARLNDSEWLESYAAGDRFA